jgi:HD-GYP domain-containing protein (c-di-GMP phosphodiesterase class II)
MESEIIIHSRDVLFRISDALDMLSPQLSQHQLRTAYIAWELCKTLHLTEAIVDRVITAALIHDIGALTPEEKIDLHNFEEVDPEPHCVLGEYLLRDIHWLGACARLVRHHHRPWMSWQNQFAPENEWIEPQIIFLADYIERKINRNRFILHQHTQIIEHVLTNSGYLFAPMLVEKFSTASISEGFWLELVSPQLYNHLQKTIPCSDILLSLEEFSRIGVLLRNIIDFRTPYTATHSSGVAKSALHLAKLCNFSEYDLQLMWVAGNLHDFGKVGIPTRILEKPGRLSTKEHAIMKQHAFFTYNILNGLHGFEQICEWAAFHHENLRGTGYPFRLAAEKVPLGARIISVADNITAMIEKRPYRSEMTDEQTQAILLFKSRRNYLDEQIVTLAMNDYQNIVGEIRKAQALAVEHYQMNFAPWMRYDETGEKHE